MLAGGGGSRSWETFWKGRRVLITGITGFKGAWLCLWLRKLGAVVNGLALSPQTTPSLWGLIVGAELAPTMFGDVRDSGVVEAAFFRGRPEIVFHLAAQALVQPSYEDPAGTFGTNVMGTVHVLEAARRTACVRAVVNVTSDKCYENREQIWAYRESDPMGGADPYSASKGCAELVTASWRRSFYGAESGPFLASARAGNVIGGGDWSADRLIPDCVRAFGAGSAVRIRHPSAVRPWQHVLEPLAGYLRLGQALYEQGQEVAEGWNFGPSDDDAWPVGRVVERFAELWGGEVAWVAESGGWAPESLLLRVDATKARLRLGWAPRLNIEQALEWTVDWYKACEGGGDVKAFTLEQIEKYEALGVQA